MALGAGQVQIFRLVVGQGLRLSVIGIGAGLIGAFGLTRLLRAMLVGIKATDPATFVIVAMAFLVVAAVASLLPARRAAALDPARALREE
jgi:putative ABC transport system permease protein